MQSKKAKGPRRAVGSRRAKPLPEDGLRSTLVPFKPGCFYTIGPITLTTLNTGRVPVLRILHPETMRIETHEAHVGPIRQDPPTEQPGGCRDNTPPTIHVPPDTIDRINAALDEAGRGATAAAADSTRWKGRQPLPDQLDLF